jgi:DNA-binding MurR/RpiR family transcriptional regulator
MNRSPSPIPISQLAARLGSLTPKSRILAEFILQHPRKAVFMTTRQLAEACRVSEATVVRFVDQIGYDGYGAFLQALREHVDTGLSLPDRIDLPSARRPGTDLLHGDILEEMANLKKLYAAINEQALAGLVEHLAGAGAVYVIGARLSYTYAYYLGWALGKVRANVTILKGSDSTAIDRLAAAPAGSLVVIIATTRYPNELIKLGKVARRLKLNLFVLTDSSLCPLVQFAHQSLVVPSRSIPLIGNPASMCFVINHLVLCLARRSESASRQHQQRLEQVYLENDILFNLQPQEPAPAATDRRGGGLPE